MMKKLIAYESGIAQPCRIHCPTERDSGYMLHNATPEEDPNHTIEPPKPTLNASTPQS